MAFQYPVPAQQLAADYVTRVARLWQGDLVLPRPFQGREPGRVCGAAGR